MRNSPFTDLPALELEDRLHRALVEPQQRSHRPLTERRFFLDQGLNRFHKSRVHLGPRPAWLVVNVTPDKAQPTAEFGQWNLKTVIF